jgi:hypothetical protein
MHLRATFDSLDFILHPVAAGKGKAFAKPNAGEPVSITFPQLGSLSFSG